MIDAHLGQELDGPILLLVQFQNPATRGEGNPQAVENLRPVHDWDVSAIDLEDNDLSHPDVLLLVVGQEEKVSSLQRMRSTCFGKLRGHQKHQSRIEKQEEKLFKEETWKAGSMLPERTTTMGDSEPVTTIRPFQIIRAEDTIIPNDNTWDRT